MRTRATLVVFSLVAATAASPSARAAGPSAYDHLRAIVGLSQPPDYRRAGSPGMVAMAGYAAAQLGGAGYSVVHQDFSLPRYVIDYTPGHEPLLERADGVRFKAESGFDLKRTTGAAGVTCVVRQASAAGPGECGFIPFGDASPEWKNQPLVNVGTTLKALAAKGAAGAIVQGDVARDLVFALRVREALPTVIAVAAERELVGRTVRLRAMGASIPTATGHNVIGVMRPPAGSSEYVVLLAHADGWFQAASDNGSGAAAVLRTAQLLAAWRPGIGVIAGLMDGEEIGLLGAERFAVALDKGLAVGDGGPPIRMDDVKAVINLDASSARASDVQDTARAALRQDAPFFQWRAMVFSEEPVLAAAFLARFAARGVLGLPIPASIFRPVSAGTLDGRLRTDAHHFAARGVPFVWPVSGYPEYHTDGDTLAAVDAADLEAIAFAARDLAADIALMPIGRVPGPFVPASAGVSALPLAVSSSSLRSRGTRRAPRSA